MTINNPTSILNKSAYKSAELWQEKRNTIKRLQQDCLHTAENTLGQFNGGFTEDDEGERKKIEALYLQQLGQLPVLQDTYAYLLANPSKRLEIEGHGSIDVWTILEETKGYICSCLTNTFTPGMMFDPLQDATVNWAKYHQMMAEHHFNNSTASGLHWDKTYEALASKEHRTLLLKGMAGFTDTQIEALTLRLQTIDPTLAADIMAQRGREEPR